MNEQQFLQKIETHKGIIYKISKVYFENDNDREDLFQEIILQTWKSIPSFRKESNFSTWLYRIALNTAIIYFKKEKKRKNIITNETTYPEKITSNDQVKEKQIEVFYKAIYHLDHLEKALILQYIDGLSGKEISANLGMTEVNVRVRINRTKKKLQEIIKSLGYEF